MSMQSARQEHIYTVVTIVCLGLCYELFHALVRPLIPEHSVWSTAVYAGSGVFLLLIFGNTRRFVRMCIRRLVLGVTVSVEDIEARLISIFSQYTDKTELGERVRSSIIDSMGFENVGIFLRSEAKEFVSVLDKETTQTNDALRRALLARTTWSVFVRAEWTNDAVVQGYIDSARVQLIVPLSINNTLIGWIECYGRKNRLLHDTRTVLERVRPLLSVTFHRVMLDVKFAIRIEQLVALNRISQTMNSSLNVKETLDGVMDSILQLIHVDRAIMYLVNDDGMRCVPRIGRGLGATVTLDFEIEIAKSIFSHVMKSRQPMVVEDVEHDERVNQAYAALVQTKSFVIVPMVSKERVIGIIGVDNLVSGKSVKEINVELLVTLANTAAIALTNSRLYEEVHNFNGVLQERIDAATTHLRALLEMKSHFLSVASHQLRTPTTVIKGMLSMIEEDADLPHDKIREFVHHAFISSGRLERIVNELLSATELEDPQVRIHVEEVDIVELVRGIVAHLEPLATQRHNTLIVRSAFDTLSLRTDKYKLLEALANLIDNAIRYTKDGDVTVSITSSDAMVSIAIEDTGLGITTIEREQIFDKFSRGDESVEMDPNGTGLGLYIVKRTLEVLHGSIDVHSEGRGKGSCFIVHLPQLPEDRG